MTSLSNHHEKPPWSRSNASVLGLPIPEAKSLRLWFLLVINKCSRLIRANKKHYATALAPMDVRLSVWGIDGRFGRDEFMWGNLGVVKLCGPPPSLHHLTLLIETKWRLVSSLRRPERRGGSEAVRQLPKIEMEKEGGAKTALRKWHQHHDLVDPERQS